MINHGIIASLFPSARRLIVLKEKSVGTVLYPFRNMGNALVANSDSQEAAISMRIWEHVTKITKISNR